MGRPSNRPVPQPELYDQPGQTRPQPRDAADKDQCDDKKNDADSPLIKWLQSMMEKSQKSAMTQWFRSMMSRTSQQSPMARWFQAMMGNGRPTQLPYWPPSQLPASGMNPWYFMGRQQGGMGQSGSGMDGMMATMMSQMQDRRLDDRMMRQFMDGSMDPSMMGAKGSKRSAMSRQQGMYDFWKQMMSYKKEKDDKQWPPPPPQPCKIDFVNGTNYYEVTCKDCGNCTRGPFNVTILGEQRLRARMYYCNNQLPPVPCVTETLIVSTFTITQYI